MNGLRRLHNAIEALMIEVKIARSTDAITQEEAFSLTQPLGDLAQKLNVIVDARLAAQPVPPPLRLPPGVGRPS